MGGLAGGDGLASGPQSGDVPVDRGLLRGGAQRGCDGGGGGAQVGVLLEAAKADVGDLWRDTVDRREWCRSQQEVGPDGFVWATDAPGQLVGEQPVDEHTQGVDVRGSGDVAAEEPFGCDVGRRAEDRAVIVEIGRARSGGDAEVDDLRAVGGEHHVGRLDVTVDQAVVVQGGERAGDLGADGDRFGR